MGSMLPHVTEKFIMPTNRLNFLTICGKAISSMALTLLGIRLIPSRVCQNPRYSNSTPKKLYFLALIFTPADASLFSTSSN